MKYFLTTFDKRGKTTEALEQELNLYIQGTSVHTLNISENQSTGDVLFEILTTDNKDKSDTFVIFPLQNIYTVRDTIKSFIRNTNTDDSQEVKTVKLLPLGGQRALGVLLITRKQQDDSASHQEKTERKPNKKANGPKNTRTTS